MNTLRQNRRNVYVRTFPFVFFLATVHWPLATAYAGGPGSASVQILKTDVSPRAMGMGGNFVAVADDIYTANYNPAGIGQLYIPEVSAMYLSGFEDSKLQYMAAGMPLSVTGLAGQAKPGLAFSAILSSNGRFTYRPIDSAGTVASYSTDAENTKVFAFTYGEKVYSGETNIEGYKAKFEQYLGLSAKYIGSELAGKFDERSKHLGTYSASAFAVDAGWLVRESNLGLTFGASLSNSGTGIKYRSETEPLPSILRTGLSYQRPTIMDQSILLALEYDMYTNESLKSLRTGLEYNFEKIFSFRLGYKSMEDNSGLTMGLGIRHEGLTLDFAMSLSNEVFNASQVGVSYKFANWRPSEYKKRVEYRDQEEDRPLPRKIETRKTVQPSRKEPAKPIKRKTAQASTDSDFLFLYDTGQDVATNNKVSKQSFSPEEETETISPRYSERTTDAGRTVKIGKNELGFGLIDSIPIGNTVYLKYSSLGCIIYDDFLVNEAFTLGGEFYHFPYINFWGVRGKFIKPLNSGKLYGILGIVDYGTAADDKTKTLNLDYIVVNIGGGYDMDIAPNWTAGLEVRYYLRKGFNTIAPMLKVAYSFGSVEQTEINSFRHSNPVTYVDHMAQSVNNESGIEMIDSISSVKRKAINSVRDSNPVTYVNHMAQSVKDESGIEVLDSISSVKRKAINSVRDSDPVNYVDHMAQSIKDESGIGVTDSVSKGNLEKTYDSSLDKVLRKHIKKRIFK